MQISKYIYWPLSDVNARHFSSVLSGQVKTVVNLTKVHMAVASLKVHMYMCP